MATGNIHVGDVGTVFQVLFEEGGEPLDISANTALQIKFERPTLGLLTVDAELVTDGTDGLAQFTSLADTLSQAGTWGIQGYAEIPGWSGHTGTGTFRVERNLPYRS
jgi:hypothetical protein